MLIKKNLFKLMTMMIGMTSYGRTVCLQRTQSIMMTTITPKFGKKALQVARQFLKDREMHLRTQSLLEVDGGMHLVNKNLLEGDGEMLLGINNFSEYLFSSQL